MYRFFVLAMVLTAGGVVGWGCNDADLKSKPSLTMKKTKKKTLDVHMKTEPSPDAESSQGEKMNKYKHLIIKKTAEKNIVKKASELAEGLAQEKKLYSGLVRGARNLSKRSFSLKVFFKGGGSAVFKPILTKLGNARYEVASYRVSELLEYHRVPISIFRTIPKVRLMNTIEKASPDWAVEFENVIQVNSRGYVEGAAISWVSNIGDSGLDSPAGMKKMKSLVSLGGPSSQEAPLAPEVSSMIVFDYITGNWDRFSGGNLFVNEEGSLVLIDNNGSFYKWSQKKQQYMDKLLQSCQRFSRGLIGKLRQLDYSSIETAMAPRSFQKGRRPLLTPVEIDRILARTSVVLKHVDRLIGTHGDAEILVFP